MSVNVKDIPNMEELLSMIPESSYTKNNSFVDRRVTQLQAVNNALLGESFVPGLEASFRVNPSQSCLISPSECYFTVNGSINFKYVWYASAAAAAATNIAPVLKPAPLWLLRAFSKISCDISGSNIYNITQPYNLSNFVSMFYKDNRSIKNGEFVKDMFYPTQYDIEFSRGVDGGVAGYGLKLTGSDLSYAADANITVPVDDVFSLDIQKSKITIDTQTVTCDLTYNFTVNMNLKDMFPGLLNKKPLYGSSLVINLNLDGGAYTAVKNMYSIMGKIVKFNQFYLNVVSYGLNTDFAAKLSQIYSKPGLMEVVEDISYLQQGCVNLSSDSQLDIYIPLNLQFENEFVVISFPYMTANNQGFVSNSATGVGRRLYTYKTLFTDLPEKVLVQGLDGKKIPPLLTNYLMKNPNDYNRLNIMRVQVEADNQILYTRSFNNSKLPPNPTSNNGTFILSTINLATQGQANDWNVAAQTYYDNFDYTELYQNYKDCRLYCGQYEEGAISYEDFLKYGFCICIPTHEFSKLTTPSSQLKISILFGPGVSLSLSAAGDNTIGTTLNSYWDNQFVIQNKIQVIQKSSKGIVYNGFDSCSVKAISASFSNDIVVEDGNAEKIAQ